MPTLSVIITGDSTKLKREMAAIDAMAKRTGQNIKTSMSGGGSGGGHTGGSGAIRESMVLIRELARGDLKRAAGSASLLVQYLGLMKYLLNPIAAAILAIAGGFVAAYKLSGALVHRLTGLKIPEFKGEYIANHLKRINAVAEAQKEVNKEIQTGIDLYNSAAKSAERIAEASKEHYSHVRKMAEYAEEKDMKGAHTEAERASVRAKYAKLNLDISNQERDQTVKNKEAEAKALVAESEKAKRQANAILSSTPSKAGDENILASTKKQADEAQKYLDDLEKSKHSTGGKAKEGLVRGYNAMALSGVSGKDLDAAEKANKEEAARRIQAHKDAVEKTAANEVARTAAGELTKQAGSSGAKAAEAFMAANDLKKTNAQKGKDDAEESAAKLDAENAKQQKYKAVHGNVNSLQKVGAYASPATLVLIDIHRNQLTHLKSIDKKISGSSGRSGFGSVNHG